MKKIYQNPTLEVIEMQPVDIMAGSFKGQLGDDGVDGGASLVREAIFPDWGENVLVIE